MKKTLSIILSALMLAGLSTAAAAWEKGTDYVVVEEVVDAADYKAFPDAYPYSTTTEGLAPVTTGELLKGTIIAGGTAEKNSTEGHNGSLAFDGDPSTYFEIFEITTRSYVGLQLDQAYELTEIRVTPASEQPTDRFHGLHVQGSNDGETWVNVVAMRQDAHGKDSHIFTPYTVTDQAYIDAGYSARADESIWWVGKGEAFSMYRIVNPRAGCQLSIGEVEFYGVAKEATNVTAENINEYTPSTYYFPNHICVRNAEAVSTDGSLVGTIIGAGGSWNKALYEYAFDGNNKKAYDPSFRGPNCWTGMMFDEPHALTEVRIMPKRGAYKNIETCQIQGSLDGINWVTLTTFTAEDVPEKQVWVSKEITDTNGYTYFRYISDNSKHGDVADILFFGAPAAAAANVEAKVTPRSDLSVFNGEIIDTGAAVVPVDGSIAGTVIGAGQYYMWNDDSKWANGFDGDFATNFSNDQFGMAGWTGIKAEAATAVTGVRIAPTSNGLNIEGTVAQGSADGINWVTLAEFGEEDIPAEQRYVTKEITDTNAYTYFRIVTKEYNGNAFAEAQFFAGEMPAAETDAPETAAPETAAPETAAPETAAPETAAPETAAPETAAPETAAPETAAPETAAPETEAPADTAEDSSNTVLIIGIAVAAVAVVAIVAGVIAKKKK